MESSAAEKISYLRVTLKGIQQKIAQAQSELDDLNADLYTFEEAYEAQVGHLLEALLRIEHEVNSYLKQIQEMRDEQRYGNGYRPADVQFAEKWQHVPEAEGVEKRPFAPPPLKENQLKKLYRQLARHYHPDLASSDDEKKERTQKMAAINDAYQAGSIVELMAFSEELNPEATSRLYNTIDPQTEQTMLNALRQEIASANKKLRQLKQEISNFHLKPLVEFALEVKLALREGRDLLAETALELQKQIARKTVERDMLASQFSQIKDHLE